MNKLELINAVVTDNDLTKSEAKHVVNKFFDEISDALVNGDRVEIRGLCSFFVKNDSAYTGRNPKTCETVPIASKKLPFFKCGKELKERVDN